MHVHVRPYLYLCQVKLPLIKTSDNHTSFTSKINEINENKIVKKSVYNKIMSVSIVRCLTWLK